MPASIRCLAWRIIPMRERRPACAASFSIRSASSTNCRMSCARRARWSKCTSTMLGRNEKPSASSELYTFLDLRNELWLVYGGSMTINGITTGVVLGVLLVFGAATARADVIVLDGILNAAQVVDGGGSTSTATGFATLSINTGA